MAVRFADDYDSDGAGIFKCQDKQEAMRLALGSVLWHEMAGMVATVEHRADSIKVFVPGCTIGSIYSYAN